MGKISAWFFLVMSGMDAKGSFKRQFYKMVKHAQAKVCLTILWGWCLKG